MSLTPLTRLCLASMYLIAASPLTVTASVILSRAFLPAALQQNLPQCAQSCLEDSLAQKFPVACTAQSNMQCLCSHYAYTGESLGEVALGCIYSSCSGIDRDRNTASAYNICIGQKDAVMPTKTALTLVASNTPHTTSTPSAATATITSGTTPIRSQTSPTQSAFADSVFVIPPATSSNISSPTEAASAAENTSHISAAQVAGLTVAAVAAFILAIGLMALSVCLRKRKERKFVLLKDPKDFMREPKNLTLQTSFSSPLQKDSVRSRKSPSTHAPIFRESPKHTKLKNGVQSASLVNPKPVHFVQRPGPAVTGGSSNSSLPLSQIGLAISAGNSQDSQKNVNPALRQPRSITQQQCANRCVQRTSTFTQHTVFEEDGLVPNRRSSILLPTPPPAVPPIRNLRPSRQQPATIQHGRQLSRTSELFLDIPIWHERPPPQRLNATDIPSIVLPQAKPVLRTRLAPPIELTPTSSHDSQANTASSRGPDNGGDVLDHRLANQTALATRISPAPLIPPKQATKGAANRSPSTTSPTGSRASSNVRDSLWSQTSFETADPSDPTPEDEDDDKQLSDDSFQPNSPAAESPISNLRYPKVPRASNQLVPRSPRSPYNARLVGPIGKSPRKPLQPTSLLEKRRQDVPPLRLESRLTLQTPHEQSSGSPPQRQRAHMRSMSSDHWGSPTTKFKRKNRVQSGMSPISPLMYEQDFVRPLKIRSKVVSGGMREPHAGKNVKLDELEEGGLTSPIWVPRLTPSRKGEDLFISVGWGSGVSECGSRV